MWRCFQSTLHKLDGYGRKKTSSGRYVRLAFSHVVYLTTSCHSFFATLLHPAWPGRRSSPKDRRSIITPPTPGAHPRLWKTTAGFGRRPLTNNEAGASNVLRNVSPISKEMNPTPREQLLSGPSHNLTLQDRYWIMQACLARISRVEGSKIHSGESSLDPNFKLLNLLNRSASRTPCSGSPTI